MNNSENARLPSSRVLHLLGDSDPAIALTVATMLGQGSSLNGIPEALGSARRAVLSRANVVLNTLVETPELAERASRLSSEFRNQNARLEMEWRRRVELQLGWVRAQKYFETVDFALSNVRGYEEWHRTMILEKM